MELLDGINCSKVYTLIYPNKIIYYMGFNYIIYMQLQSFDDK